MKVQSIHLSDLHFRRDGNQIYQKSEKLYEAVRNLSQDADLNFILVTGDIASSGKQEEYQNAGDFISKIKIKIEQYTNKKVNVVIIPGNHDCDFDTKKESVRDKLINTICQDGGKSIDDPLIDECCEAQSKYRIFENNLSSGFSILKDNKLLKIIEYKQDNFNIIFYCFNTAWMCKRNGGQGNLFFPLNLCEPNEKERKSDLSISLLHHPFNWQNSVNSRALKEYVEDISDIVLTGHEHSASKSLKDNCEGKITSYIEGSILQEHVDDQQSGFNVVILDLSAGKQKILNFQWKEEMYSLSNQGTEWINFVRSQSLNKKVFQHNSEFKDFLNDAGASFTHPYKQKVYLDDIFVFPNMRDLRIEGKKAGKDLENILSSSLFLKIDPVENKLILSGAEKSGKSALCKVILKNFYNNDYVPVFIDGHKIKSASGDAFFKLINDCFSGQYQGNVHEKFDQLDNLKKILIIDDWDKSKLNPKYRFKLLTKIMGVYPNIILTVNDLYRVEEMIAVSESVYNKFQQYGILEFGSLLRQRLIEKWNILGQEELITPKELLRKEDESTQIVDVIIGRNFVPSFPIFILTILQSIEGGKSLDLAESSYGYYYMYLIIQSLGRIVKKNEEIDTCFNYLSALASYFFENQIIEISANDFHEFHDKYCNEYRIKLNFKDFRDILVQSSLIEDLSNLFKFRYRYVYYFFVSKYLSDNISNPEIKQKIASMCSQLYRTEFANIIMFLIHHSKNPFILDEILKNAKELFKENQPIRLDDDIEVINQLTSEVPKLVFKDSDFKDNREKKLEEKEKSEQAKDKEISDVDAQGDDELDYISRLNLTFKTIEILGQILKNHYGSLKGTQKLGLVEEAYNMGLRSLSSFFAIFKADVNPLVHEIQEIIEQMKKTKEEGNGQGKKREESKEEIEKLARRILFEMCSGVSYQFIKKISGFVGSEKLALTFEDIKQKIQLNSIELIDISIKLDFFSSFPINEIKLLNNKFSKNILAGYLLRRLVVDHLYMFPVKYQDKQRICNDLNIPMQIQRKASNDQSIKKRNK